MCGPKPNPQIWHRVAVDRGWPDTWERTHCGTCDAPWWTLERHKTSHPDEHAWLLRKLPSRAAYDHCLLKLRFPSAGAAEEYITTNTGNSFCTH